MLLLTKRLGLERCSTFTSNSFGYISKKAFQILHYHYCIKITNKMFCTLEMSSLNLVE